MIMGVKWLMASAICSTILVPFISPRKPFRNIKKPTESEVGKTPKAAKSAAKPVKRRKDEDEQQASSSKKKPKK